MVNRSSNRRKKMYAGKSIFGSPDRPRLSVFRSNSQIYAQVIDDLHGQTLVSASSLETELGSEVEEAGSKSEVSKLVGERIAEKAKDAGIHTVVFDRNGYRYHGRIKLLADAAREAGLKF